MDKSRATRCALGIPDSFPGSVMDWQALQWLVSPAMDTQRVRRVLRELRKIADQPHGARRRHRRVLKRKRR